MSSIDASAVPSTGSDLPVSRRVFDAVVSVFSLLLVAGVTLDVRAHADGISFAEEGFLTPEHVFFYTAFLGVAGTLLVGTYARRRAGRDWVRAVPDGYGLGVLGVLVFGFGGFGDFFWHSAFGFEQGFEAVVSPTHLMLVTGGVLFVSAPMRAARFRATPASSDVVSAIPVVVSMTLALSLLGIIGGFLNPLIRPSPHFNWAPMDSTVAMLVALPVVYLSAIVVVVRRHGAIPGAFTAIFGFSALTNTLPEGYFALVIPAVVAGVVADVAVWYAPPVRDAPRRFLALAACLPVAFVTTYFTVVDLQWGIDHAYLGEGAYNWSLHVVLGAIALAGLAGVLLATLVSASAATPGTDRVASTGEDAE